MSGAEHKEAGNVAFKARDFQKAVECYSNALREEPKNVTYLNNRAAAYLELKEYTRAIYDAETGLKIEQTAKGHARLGNAYWNLKKYAKCRDAYAKANALQPSADYQKYMAEADALVEEVPTVRGMIFSRKYQGTVLDIMVMQSALVHIVTMLLAPAYSLFFWQCLLGTFIARQAIDARLSSVSLSGIQAFASSNQGQYIILCLMFMSAPPVHLLGVSFSMFVCLDFINVGANQVVRPAFPSLYARLQPRLDWMRSRQQIMQANAAMCEVAAGMLCWMFGLSIFQVIVLWQFLKTKYRTDTYTCLAFNAVGEMLGKVFYHSMMPAPVGAIFTKVKEFLYNLAVNQGRA